jgi:hypothetical protein
MGVPFILFVAYNQRFTLRTVHEFVIDFDIYLSICLPACLSVCLWLYSPLDLGRFFSFLIPYTDSRSPWTGDQPVARPLPNTNTE